MGYASTNKRNLDGEQEIEQINVHTKLEILQKK